MLKLELKTTATLLIIIFFSLVFIYCFEGLNTLPYEGDSLAYHIPIANSIRNGEIFRPTFYLGFYPSNAEVILAVLLFLKLPLNILNVLGLILVFFALIKLGIFYGLSKILSIIFSVSIVYTNVFIRWLNTQVIDIWLALFYVFTLIVLKLFDGSKKHFFLLGVSGGLLTGVKFSGPLFLFVLLLINIRKILNKINFIKVILFAVPFSFLGLSWYLRNFWLTGNPVYPQAIYNLPGYGNWNIFALKVGEALIRFPFKFINAAISEYLGWLILIIIFTGIIFFKIYKKSLKNNEIISLLTISFLNVLIFLFLPTSENYDVIVSSFRYSLPALITIALAITLYFQEKNLQYVLIITTFINIPLIPITAYHPKLLFPIFIMLYIFYRFKLIKYLIK